MSRTKQMVTSFLAAAAALLVLGCSSGNGGAAKVSEKGEHPANWLQVHYADFFKSPEQCKTCHGSTTDPALSGGISKVSCFSCHKTAPSHQSGWALAANHGRLGAQKAAGTASGMAWCSSCHGTAYQGGTGPSCQACHTKAPHPSAPWKGTALDQPNHVFADISNAPECIKCHRDGANSHLKPSTPAAAGASPGCFNNTMCHGTHI